MNLPKVQQDRLDHIGEKWSVIRLEEPPETVLPCEGPEDTPLIHFDFP
jgi:hypothetical protein